MALADVLARGRVAALQLMTDTVKVTRVTGSTWDESTGTTVPTVVVVYQGPGKFMMSEAQGAVARSEVQGQVVTMQQPVLKLPIVAPSGAAGDPGAVVTDDVCTVLVSLDGSLAGRVVRVTGLQVHTNSTQRRFPAEIVS